MDVSVPSSPTDLESVISSARTVITELRKLEEEILNLEVELTDLRTQVEGSTKKAMTVEFKQEVLSNLDKTLHGVKTYLSNLDKIIDHNCGTFPFLTVLSEASILPRALEDGDSDIVEEFNKYLQIKKKSIEEDLVVIDTGTKMIAAAKDYMAVVKRIYL